MIIDLDYIMQLAKIMKALTLNLRKPPGNLTEGWKHCAVCSEEDWL